MKTFRELLNEMSKKDIKSMMSKYGVDSSKQDFSKISHKEEEKPAYSTKISSVYRNKSGYSTGRGSDSNLTNSKYYQLELLDFYKEEGKKLAKKYKLPTGSKDYKDMRSALQGMLELKKEIDKKQKDIDSENKRMKENRQDIKELQHEIKTDTEYPVKAFQQKKATRAKMMIRAIETRENRILDNKSKISVKTRELKELEKGLTIFPKIFKVLEKRTKELALSKIDFDNYFSE